MLGYIVSDRSKINIKENEIFSFDILHKTNLNIFVVENNRVLYKNDIIGNSCGYGHVQVLEWFKNSGYEFKYDKWAIINASKNGHFEVLEWFKNSEYEFKYYEHAINYASWKGHIDVLEWFKNSGYEFKYDMMAINWASEQGNIQVLEWFKNSRYKFKYDKTGIYYAYKYKQIKILKFFSNYINIQKLIKFSSSNIFITTVKFKTKAKYLKGYKKN
jgi:hypothetical protein